MQQKDDDQLPDAVLEPATLTTTLKAPPTAEDIAATLNTMSTTLVAAWMQERLTLIRREQKMLDALAAQLTQAMAQHDWDRAERYLKQCHHMQSEILALRNERKP
jgi:arsenate reductase-like glutaredoxin family protein